MSKKKNGNISSAIVLAIVGPILSLALIFGVIYFTFSFLGENEKDPSAEPVEIVSGLLYFTEIQLSNSSYPNEKVEFYDWGEIYNASDEDMDISGYFLTDAPDRLRWSFPEGTVVPAKGYILVNFSGEDRSGLYVNFKLSRSGGEYIYLCDSAARELDIIRTVETDTDFSMIKTESGWTVTDKCTPGYDNTEEGYSAYLATFDKRDVGLRVSEIMPSNHVTVADRDGDFSDWLEITNYSSSPVSLAGLFISDNPDNHDKWALPDVTLDAGETLLVFASKKNSYDGEYHSNFRLDADGGTILICDERGAVYEKIGYPSAEANYSLARTGDMNSELELTVYPTPGFTNNDYGLAAFAEAEDLRRGPIVINEVMTSNDYLLPMDGARCYDWIEIKNVSDKPVSLGTYFLSLTVKDRKMYALPSKILNPGEIIVLIASGDEAIGGEYTHLPFTLDGTEEEIFIFSADGAVCDAARVYDVPYRASYGRVSGESGFFYISTPTPGSDGAEGSRRITEKPSALLAAGQYNGVSESLYAEFVGDGVLYYTLDGSEPTRESSVYTEPIEISATTVVRVISCEENCYPSDVLTCNYLINENHTLPVMCISTAPDNLWSDETGIYADGLHADEYKGANYWQDWEVKADAQYFDENGGFNVEFGLQIFGATSREEPKKSFLMKFRTVYGTEFLRYHVFDSKEVTRFSSLVLRSGSQDYVYSVLRDEFMTSLVDGTTELAVQAYQPCILYVNGEYFGIYFLRDQVDEDFISTTYNVSSESVTLMRANKTAISGDATEWTELYKFISTRDMTKASNYEYVKSKINLESLADWLIAEAYVANRDSGNIKYFRSDEYDSGRWHWILYDLDWAMYPSNYANPLYYLIKPGGHGSGQNFQNEHFSRLLKNEEFLDLFLTRLAYHMDNTFNETRVVAVLDELAAVLRPEMERNKKRWNGTMTGWEYQINKIKTFLNYTGIPRSQYLINEVCRLFDLSSAEKAKYFG